MALTKMLEKRRLWHDLALLTVGLDTLLRSCDLLALKVEDVTYSTGRVRDELYLRQRKTKHTVDIFLMPKTQTHLARWIEFSGKQRGDFLFTRFKDRSAKPITHKHLVSLIKTWAEWLGLPPDDFAAHSLRRTKAVALYRSGAPIAELSDALGHKTEASTLRYLGVTRQRVKRLMLSLDMSTGFVEPEVNPKDSTKS